MEQGANRIINIGNDFCLGGRNMPPELLINCYHNRSFPVSQDPPPVATWTLNGRGQPDDVNIFVSDTASKTTCHLYCLTVSVTVKAPK